MPQEKPKEHRCSHHTTTANSSQWYNFHFSGKVIMCSVLFGLGLVLIGGLVMAIGMDGNDESKPENLNEIQSKAPMSIVGPVIMGIGGFTVFVGIIMCLFETNICRKREPDSRPLIEEQGANAAAKGSDQTAVTSSSPRREKHRHHKKSPSRKQKGTAKKSNQSKFDASKGSSPSSKPIDFQRSSSRDFTASDKFLTPPSSFASGHVSPSSPRCDAENQTSVSLLKSFTSSGKSSNASTDFQTPSSSFQDSSGSFEERNVDAEISPELPNLKNPINSRLESLQHNFLTPKNSTAEQINAESESSKEKVKMDFSKSQENLNASDRFLSKIEASKEKNDILQNEFVTPKNSYVENFEIPPKITEEKILNTAYLRQEESSAIKEKAELILPEVTTDKTAIRHMQEDPAKSVVLQNTLTDDALEKIDTSRNPMKDNMAQEKPVHSLIQTDDIKKEVSKSVIDDGLIIDHKVATNLPTEQESNLINASELNLKNTLEANLTRKPTTFSDCTPTIHVTKSHEDTSKEDCGQGTGNKVDLQESVMRDTNVISSHSKEGLDSKFVEPLPLDDSSKVTPSEDSDAPS